MLFLISLFDYIPIDSDPITGKKTINILSVIGGLEYAEIDSSQVLRTIMKIPRYLNLENIDLAMINPIIG